jgi:phosphoribosylamine--glycine ligase
VKKVFGSGKVVIEEYLEGPEFSFMSLVNGEIVLPLEIAQDHKRAYDGDKGPNTGGMGAYSPVDAISQEDVGYAYINILKRTAQAMISEGIPFKGVLYGGLMATKTGVKVIEFNARFGDPETEVVLPRMESDLVKVLLTLLENKEIKINWYDIKAFGVVVASKGYPGHYEKGSELSGIEGLTFHMGTKLIDNKFYTDGGRVLMVVSGGKNWKEAKVNTYNKVKKIQSDNIYYRKDIGYQIKE